MPGEKPSATDRFFVAPIVNGKIAKGRVLNLKGAGIVVTENEEEDQTDVEITGFPSDGNVDLDTSTFGTEGDVISMVVRAQTSDGGSQNLQQTLYLLPASTLADIVITALGYVDDGSVFRKDYRQTAKRDGSGNIILGTADENIIDAHGTCDVVLSSANPGTIRIDIDGTATEITNFRITVQIQLTPQPS